MSFQEFVALNSATAKFIEFDKSVATVEEAAVALKVGVEFFAKSLLFSVNNIPILVVVCGNKRANIVRLSDILQVPPKKIKMARPMEILELTGFSVGCVPPFGHKVKLHTIIDSCIQNLDFVFVGSGNSNMLLKISPTDIIRITEGEVVSI